MSLEIERKFLVKSAVFKETYFEKNYIKQGFLNSDKERVVRVRIRDEKGFLTIKGLSSLDGTTRYEWEKEISLTEANDLFKLCEKGSIEKYRYLVRQDSHVFEVDEFLGDNQGLVVAEVELSSVNEVFEKPSWLGDEVTSVEKYYNSSLSKFPFCKW